MFKAAQRDPRKYVLESKLNNELLKVVSVMDLTAKDTVFTLTSGWHLLIREDIVRSG